LLLLLLLLLLFCCCRYIYTVYIIDVHMRRAAAAAVQQMVRGIEMTSRYIRVRFDIIYNETVGAARNTHKEIERSIVHACFLLSEVFAKGWHKRTSANFF